MGKKFVVIVWQTTSLDLKWQFNCDWLENEIVSVKSFYSLDYTGQDFSDIDEVGVLIQGGDPPKNYSMIIQELQSHRHEIEKLHVELASYAINVQSNKGSEDQLVIAALP